VKVRRGGRRDMDEGNDWPLQSQKSITSTRKIRRFILN
jgi:hypothetical protein